MALKNMPQIQQIIVKTPIAKRGRNNPPTLNKYGKTNPAITNPILSKLKVHARANANS